jgi:hypothetical protein
MNEFKTFQSKDLFVTLNEGIAFVQANKEDGCFCPCCNQLVKVYSWKMYRATVQFLWWLSRQPEGRGHYKTYARLYGPISNFSTPRYWEFIVQAGRKTGEWQLTQDGRDFLNGKPFPKYAYVTNATVQGYSKEQVRIRISHGEDFDYEELTTPPYEHDSNIQSNSIQSVDPGRPEDDNDPRG